MVCVIINFNYQFSMLFVQRGQDVESCVNTFPIDFSFPRLFVPDFMDSLKIVIYYVAVHLVSYPFITFKNKIVSFVQSIQIQYLLQPLKYQFTLILILSLFVKEEKTKYSKKRNFIVILYTYTLVRSA